MLFPRTFHHQALAELYMIITLTMNKIIDEDDLKWINHDVNPKKTKKDL